MSYSTICLADGPTAYFYAGKVGTAVQNEGGGFLFSWNWINIFGLFIIALLLIPNIIYAIKHKGGKNLCENRWMNVLERIGRYSSMLFMVVCLFLLSGITLGYVPLVFSAILFAIGHIYVTYRNMVNEIGMPKKGTGSK